MVIARKTALTGPMFDVHSTHSSCPKGRTSAGPELVSIIPFPLRSMQSRRSAATLVTEPCIAKPRLAMYASPKPSTATREGMLQPSTWQHIPRHSPAGRPTRYRPSSVPVVASHFENVLSLVLGTQR
jgi:hypothetical protein